MKLVARLSFFSLLVVVSLAAQQNSVTGRTLVVIPFENTSPTPGLEWLGESFPVTFRSQLDSPVLYVVTRDERLRAYDRQGVPAGVHPSRATIYRLAEQMDVDYAVLGTYSYDGSRLTATAQLLDMRAQKLLPAATESAPLGDLGNLQSSLAWDLVRLIHPNFGVPKDRYIASVPPMRLDALENYVRGTVSATADEKIQDYREAVRVNPAFPEAWLELGKTYYAQHQYEQAIAALQKVSESDKGAREANFYLGLSSYAHGDYDRADRAFEFVAARLPLAEVYNDLGVVAARRGQKRAADDFERAISNDPSDPDYHFNLAVALSRSGDKARAVRELRTTLDQKPNDPEAKALLDSLQASANARHDQRRTEASSRASQSQLRGKRLPPDDHADAKLGRGTLCSLRSACPRPLSRRTGKGIARARIYGRSGSRISPRLYHRSIQPNSPGSASRCLRRPRRLRPGPRRS